MSNVKPKNIIVYPLQSKCEPRGEFCRRDAVLTRMEVQEVNNINNSDDDDDDVIFVSMRAAPVRVLEELEDLCLRIQSKTIYKSDVIFRQNATK